MVKQNVFLKLKLKPGIVKMNMVAYLLLSVSTGLALSMIYGTVTFILEDKNYYNLSEKVVGSNMGYIGMISEVAVLVLELFMGVILDTFGRKTPVIFGIFISAICLILIPLENTLYPGYLILRLIIGMGTIISVNAPFIPDYVSLESMGLASAYAGIISTLSGLFNGSVVL